MENYGVARYTQHQWNRFLKKTDIVVTFSTPKAIDHGKTV
jgi:hypothetical protein